MTRQAARAAQALVAAYSVAVTIVAATAIRGSDAVAGLLFVAAIVWGSASFFLIALLSRPARDAYRLSPEGTNSVTTVIRLGDERLDLARLSIVGAAQHGPTVVITTGRPDLDQLDAAGVPIYVAPSLEGALRDALAAIHTHAVHLVSASAIPVRPASEQLAGHLEGRCAWAIGQTRSLTNDGYASERREHVMSRLRTRARAAKLDLWEADATIIRTDVVRAQPFVAGRPFGRWLRAARQAGHRGVEVPVTVAVRAPAADARSFWPATVARQRGSVADLADATTTGSLRTRLLAIALLLRELYAFPLLLWLLAPAIVGATGNFPLRLAPLPFLGASALLALARWMSIGLIVDLRPRVASDALSLAYSAPGSLLAGFAASSRRVRPMRRALPDRPLVWGALVLTVAAALPLAGSNQNTARFSLILGLGELVLIWMFAIQALLQKNWARTATRLRIERSVAIDGAAGRAWDASPNGLAVIGDFGPLQRGAAVAATITLVDGSQLTMPAAVAECRATRAGDFVVGLSLILDGATRARWLGELVEIAGQRATAPFDQPARAANAPVAQIGEDVAPTGVKRALGRAVVALVTLLSLVIASSLVLLLLGYRPLVVRSGSMVPTLAIGDVVIVEQVRASQLRPGDIATFPDPQGGDETFTHRIVSVSDAGSVLQFETRGDANRFSEYWTAPRTTLLDHEVWRIPKVGRLVSALDSNQVNVALAGAGGALALAGAGRAMSRRGRRRVDDALRPV
jgi:signal peptidase I